jgi:hypothetical protein
MTREPPNMSEAREARPDAEAAGQAPTSASMSSMKMLRGQCAIYGLPLCRCGRRRAIGRPAGRDQGDSHHNIDGGHGSGCRQRITGRSVR